MIKNKKYKIIVTIFILILVISFIILNIKKKNEVQRDPDFSAQPINTTKPYIKSKIDSIPTKEISVNKNTNDVLILLDVLGKKYSITTKEGASVYDVMKNIEDSNFSFKTKEYPGLGIFVDEINGVRGTPGKYWIYYVNDKEASVSVSKYIIKNGDIINWKQE